MLPVKTVACFLVVPAITLAQTQAQSGVEAFRRNDYHLAAKLLPLEASRGDAEAQAVLGSLLMSGKSVPQDFTTAVFWLKESAAQGYGPGCYGLALAYFHGWGIELDWKTAAPFFKMAALKGIYDAEFHLGIIYYLPFQGTQDKIEAHAWFNVAAAHQVKGAEESRDLVQKELKMTPSEISIAQARAREIFSEEDHK